MWGVSVLLCFLESVIGALIFLIVYIAYCYHPKENLEFNSKYLTMVNSQYLRMNNFIVHYVYSGSGKPLILIHGGGTWLYSYRDNIPYISKSFSTYAVDMPGHGYTRALMKKPKYDLDMYCEFLLEFINKKKLNKVSLVGNSWGGGWALYFAEKYPDKVEKLVLIDSSGLSFHDAFEWEIFKIPILGEAVSKFINSSSVRLSLKKVFYNNEKVNDTMINEITVPLSFEGNRKAQYLAERKLDWKITANNTSNIKAPTLIIWGKNDNYLNFNIAYQFKEKIKKSSLLLLENCGHVAHEDCPDEVNKVIVDFLSDNDIKL